ncbi:HAMP domain-containing histidine kinase [Streptomyces sp. XM4193]|uniref:sensor histidine kinase n=1 Tax=Streptomyces sp. XM4193 TaxID=2929782 RepID=UPI001FFA23C1|nr:HAMP domain-containing sensor histidine kinase [Streptomyces sp. XM4193]MCK1797525.1 HAMP domain-containing histidine kinase [Streptomyces sp. XM4193]
MTARFFASVKARAALGATLVVAVALAAAGVAVVWLLETNLVREVDLQAEVRARDVAGQIATGTALGSIEVGDQPVQILDENDRVRAVSDGLDSITGTPAGGVKAVGPTASPTPTRPSPEKSAPSNPDDDDDDDSDDDDDDDDRDPPRNGDGNGDNDGEDPLGPGEVDDDLDFVGGSAVVDGSGGDYRFAVAEAKTPRGEALTIYAGAPLDLERAAVDTIRNALLIGGPLLLVIVAVTTWRVTRQALRPVDGIRQEMSEITRSTDLSRRVPEPQVEDEVGRLARTTNETLAALESSVERQRRFVADASHELRSPIASLRTQLEVAEAHPELLDLPGAVHDTVRLQDLAADLLLLARIDAGERPVGARLDLAALVDEELDRRTADPHPITAQPLESAEVTGSGGQLARILGNLLDNAQRHAAGRVRVSVRTTATGTGDVRHAELEVADDGAGVPEAERDRVFERFVRLDDARSRDDGGAGLGLAIAREVATRHGGTLTLTAAPEGGALFTLRLPLAD